jgi:major membrane immunogen (membrane-anchored lipoprotein)
MASYSQGFVSDRPSWSPRSLLGWKDVISPLRKFCAALAAIALIFLGSAVTIGAQSTVSPTSTGYDISFPQCGYAYPAAPGFGVVGVNGGKPFTTNKCLASELTWAKGAINSEPAFYVNTGNGGPNGGQWPTSQSTPDACSGANSVPCSYDYGWNAAAYSFSAAVTAETSDGASSPNQSAISSPWWLDVETGNAWEVKSNYYGPTAAAYANDTAMIEGEIASLKNFGVTTVGVYSTSQQWRAITDASTTNFPSVPVWIPGFGSVSAAEAGCTTASFTSARVAMIQYGSGSYDGDYDCGLLFTPVTTSVTAANSATFNDQLVTTNNDGTVTYVQTSGTPDLVVSASGAVTTSGALPDGTYTASGTTSDPHGDLGTFSLTLEVGVLLQASPTAANVKASGSAAFSDQLSVTGNTGTVTFTQSTGTPSLIVNSSGLLTTSGTLAAGSYSATGTASDPSGDEGSYAFTLTVGKLVQRTPTAASVAESSLSTFSEQLSVGANLGTVSFVQTAGSPDLSVNSTGLVTALSTLTPGVYKASGTTSDPNGDVGTFAFALTVTAPIVTPSPTTTTTTLPVGPVAFYVRGHAIAGRTVMLAIDGSGFVGQPRVTSHAGTTAQVLRDTGTVLIVRVSVKAKSRNGVFTFTITLANGKSCHVLYNQR